MRFAYADPPYIGQARKLYGDEEVDHEQLLIDLQEYEGWVLSCSSPSLKQILGYSVCPDDVRIGSWVKPFCSFKPNVNPAYAWEPVLFYGGRKRGRDLPTARDFVTCNITLKKGLCGVKPEKFSFWVFEIMNAQPGDEFFDLFPGSGAVTRAWEKWCQQYEEIGHERHDG